MHNNTPATATTRTTVESRTDQGHVSKSKQLAERALKWSLEIVDVSCVVVETELLCDKVLRLLMERETARVSFEVQIYGAKTAPD